MSLLGAQAAKCSLTIKDAHTYGIDSLQIEKQVRDWAADNRDFLRSFRQKETRKWCVFTSKEQYYVRIVTRVYLAREFNVSVSTADSGGLGLTAGLKTKADMVKPSADAEGRYDASAIYNDTLETINNNLSSAGDTTGKPAIEKDAAGKVTGVNFGAALKVIAASSRYVSLDEKLPRPVAVGYLAIDLPIMDDGKLGRRVSTLGLLETGREPVVAKHLGPQSQLTAKISYDVYRWLRGDPGDRKAKKLTEVMGQFAAGINIPNDLKFYGAVGKPPKAAFFEEKNAERMRDLETDRQNKTFARFKSYSTLLSRSIGALERWGTPEQSSVLAGQKELYEELTQQLRSSASVKEAHRHYMARFDK